MEYGTYMQLFAESTTFDESLVSSELSDSMKAWMQSNPDLSYHFASQIIANYPSPRY